MPIDNLPNVLKVPTRDELIADFLRDVAYRSPTTGIGNGTLANLDAAAMADMLLPVYAECVRQADSDTLDGMTLTQLKREAKDAGLTEQLPAAGASGFVIADTSSGGANILFGAEAVHPQTGKRYTVLVGGVYLNGSNVPVVGVTTGPETNVAAGTVLQWTSPAAGLNLHATVYTQTDGTGLTGGRNAETADEIVIRIRANRNSPAANGNDADYQKWASQTPGLSIAAAFTYPCWGGPGTTSLVFLMRPAKIGGSRIPNNAQIGLVQAFVTGKMSKEDSCTYGTIVADPHPVALSVQWAKGVAKWTDATPWPPYGTSGNEYTIDGSYANTATTFKVLAAGTVVQPVIGQTIAIYDMTPDAGPRFVQKRILSFTGASPWVITCDTTNGASDTQVVPVGSSLVSPWSDSLNLLPAVVQGYFDTLGPGEQLNTALVSFYDDGYRQRRSPPDPSSWPMSVTSRMLTPIEQLSAVNNVTVQQPVLPLLPAAGTLGSVAKLLTLSSFGAYP